MVLTEAERVMVEAFRMLPGEVRAAISGTIQSQADFYNPERVRNARPSKLSLVVGGRCR
jgi:hypothetical protein